jgi:hypothetical protein
MKNQHTLIISLASVLFLGACGKSDKKPAENADPVENKGGSEAKASGESGDDKPAAGGDEMKAPSFDCATLVTDADVEKACGKKATIKKLPTEGATESAGTTKLLHVCHRDLEFNADTHVTVAINFVGGSQTGEEYVRSNMETAGAAGWGKKLSNMTGYMGMPPSTDDSIETAELRGLVRGTVISLTSTHKALTDFGCNEPQLMTLANIMADRVPAAPSR